MPLSDGTARPTFNLPKNTSGHGNALRFGRGLHVYYDLQPSNAWEEHSHPHAQIVLALDPVDAEMSWRNKSKVYGKKSGAPYVWFVPSNAPHAMTWRGGAAAMLVFYLDNQFILQECGVEPGEGVVLRLSPLVQQDYMLCRFCHHFRELCHGRCPMSESMIFAGAAVLASKILHACLRRSALHDQEPDARLEKRLEAAFNYIDLHIAESITPTELATLIGLSRHHFSRIFRQVTGCAPMKFIWRCRLQRARQLLESGEKVAVVAAELGFCDQSHLDRKFRKEFGCSPGSVAPGRLRSQAD